MRGWNNLAIGRLLLTCLLAISTASIGVPRTHAKGDLNPEAIAVDGRIGRVFISNYGAGDISVLDARSGRFLRTLGRGGQPAVAIAVDAATNRLFLGRINTGGTPGGTVAVLDAVSGRLVRTVNVTEEPRSIVVDEPANRVFVVDGAPYLDPQSRGGISVLDATDGRVLSSLEMGRNPLAAAVDAPAGRFFVAVATYHQSSDSWATTIDMRDAATGRLLRAIALPAYSTTAGVALAIDDRAGRVFVTYGSLIDIGYGSTVQVLDAVTGDPVNTVTMRPSEVDTAGMAPGGMAIDPAAGRAYVTSFDVTTYAGRLSIFNTTTGRLIRTASAGLGKNPVAVTTAAVTGRLVVIDGRYGNGQVQGDGSVRILDAATGRLLYSLLGDAGTAAQVATAGHLAFLIDADSFASVLDLRNGQIVHTVNGFSGAVT